MARIFISYSRIDEAFARQLASQLRSVGADVWLDVEDIPAGMNWSRAIQTGLDESELMLVIISPESMASQDVEEEWQDFRDNRKPIIPLLWRDAKVHYQLRRKQHIDFKSQSFDKAFTDLYHELRRNGVDLAPLEAHRDVTSRIVIPRAPTSPEPQPQKRRFVLPIVIAVAAALIVLIGGAALVLPNLRLTPSPTPTDPLTLAQQGVTSNEDWTAYPQDFGGVAMTLVPRGCFNMGSDANADERPIHEQCFEQPFWIDTYEVTNAQFALLGGQAAVPSQWSEADRPRENITWAEASAFCALRGARLPTEREWEYAARGVDNWIYAWNGEFAQDNVVFFTNANSQTAPVGSRAGGVSWVGAYDLLGNVREWVNTLYGYDGNLDREFVDEGDFVFSYPYNGEDGREAPLFDPAYQHGVRGGSWNLNIISIRNAKRGWEASDLRTSDIGFRCARDFGDVTQ
jgi:formylglycine-generating enzyme required for sulfatase activity